MNYLQTTPHHNHRFEETWGSTLTAPPKGTSQQDSSFVTSGLRTVLGQVVIWKFLQVANNGEPTIGFKEEIPGALNRKP